MEVISIFAGIGKEWRLICDVICSVTVSRPAVMRIHWLVGNASMIIDRKKHLY